MIYILYKVITYCSFPDFIIAAKVVHPQAFDGVFGESAICYGVPWLLDVV